MTRICEIGHGVDRYVAVSGGTPVAPAAQFAQRLGDLAFERGLIVYPGRGSVDGTAGDHILLGPHYITTEAEADEIVGLLDECIGAVESHAPA